MRKISLHLRTRTWSARLHKLVHRPEFARQYGFGCMLVLTITTTIWATLGGKLQATNADQLADPYLFENGATFHGALFPGAHTFLIKWPLFILVRLLGYSNEAFLAVTVLTVLLTVGSLAYILYRIESRPLVFGTLCLMLSSVLLLVPAVPSAGTLLPMNMAMLTTRNLEYIVFIGALAALVGSKYIRTRQFWIGVALMLLLIASDKLFISLSLAAALAALLVYVLRQNWQLARKAALWLVITCVCTTAAVLLLGLINLTHISNIVGQTGAGPYGLVVSAKQFVLGVFYGGLALLTNFGANPAFDAMSLRQVGGHAWARLASLSALAFVVNLFIALLAVWAASTLLRSSLRKNSHSKPDNWRYLALALVWLSGAAFAVFVLTNHYYPVDARYLTITLFTGFICLAVYLRRRRPKPELLVIAGAIIVIGMLVGLPVTLRTYWDDRLAITEMRGSNELVAQALDQHHVKILLGDYWRVLPIKSSTAQPQAVLPLSGCTAARDVLSSRQWQQSLKGRSFAYLLTLDNRTADFPACDYNQIVKSYGRPNASLVIAGRVSHPTELLLFYDRGINNLKKSGSQQVSTSVEPIKLHQLPDRNCDVPTIMNIVAHEDDDLLFMNPDIFHDLDSGNCIRTVYVTAGDAGHNYFYWLGREQATEAAYANMVGSNTLWIQRTVELGANEYATVATLADNTKLTLLFMQLPDGNVNGKGFAVSHYETLAKVDSIPGSAITSVDGQSTYHKNDLLSALTALMHFYQPSEIRTQSTYVSQQFPDHSDHMAVSRLVDEAYAHYDHEQYGGRVAIPVKHYMGYPVREFPENVGGNDLVRKEAIFLTYAKYDGAVCQNIQTCSQTSTYGAYLPREYQTP